ncbi:hypothetical protein [Polaromonas glacialis]|uniref:hypothetical protein n=1 Tax=Polaromonas glacialis TaxID=866564 RepID=UPI000497ADA3|nr:hypothetical protein [Polaromonas glacialis]
MNWNQGLRRLSAAIWGFFAFGCGIFGFVFLFLNASREWGFGLALIAFLIPLYIGHKVTCWIVDGFFQGVKRAPLA